MSLPLIPQDKANHYAYGSWVGLAAIALCHMTGFREAAPLCAVAAGAIVGIAKEFRDHTVNERELAAGRPAPHGVELGDFVWTLAGSLSVAAAAFIQDTP